MMPQPPHFFFFWRSIKTKELNSHLIKPQQHFPPRSHSPLSAVWQTPGWLSSSFYSRVAPSTHSAIKARLAECCWDSFPTGRLSRFCRRTLQWVAIEFLVTSLTETLLAYLLILARWLTVGRVLVVSDLFNFTIMEFTLLLGTLNVKAFFIPFPGTVPRHNSHSGGLHQVPLTFLFCFFNIQQTTYIVKNGMLCTHHMNYVDIQYAFLNQSGL